MESATLYEQFATELEASLPAAAPGAGTILGLYTEVQNLIAALKAKDVKGIMVAVRNILNVFIGDDGGIQFAPTAMAAGINWGVLIAVLKRLLPIILDEIV
jgi:hypothetical protein